MDLQSYLVNKFEGWRPPPPVVEGRTKSDVTLSWSLQPFAFMQGELLFWVQKKAKMPPWVMVYSGGKTTKKIDFLPPRHPHNFRLKVILKATAVPTLAANALQFFGDEKRVYEYLEGYKDAEDNQVDNVKNYGDELSHKDKEYKSNEQANIKLPKVGEGDTKSVIGEEIRTHVSNGERCGDENIEYVGVCRVPSKAPEDGRWLESRWSEETSTSTDTDGTSAVCFCMALRCGYLKQVQVMLEERPALLEIINSSSGFTPLATAVRKGDMNSVKFLLSAGADVNSRSTTGQTPLHLATLGAQTALIELLLDKGADFEARDLNGLRIEHYAVDSGSLAVLALVLQRGGDVAVRDDNGWTPLFRAVTQGAETELIEQLVLAGSDVDILDYAGLALTSTAHLLTNRQGRRRDSVLRLVDSQYPHEIAVANFTRLTKKISSLHTILK